MKNSIIYFFGFFLIAAACNLFAQDQQAWQEYMTPGPVQQSMAESAGDWNVASTMWMDPSQPPQKFELTAKNEMILGGRYLKQTISGNMMGMPYEAIMILGFDNAKKIFTSVWYDNFGTGTTISSGSYNNDDSTLTLLGTMVDPTSGNDIKFREMIKLVDNDNQIITMYIGEGDKEFKNMEDIFTRKK